MRDEVKPLDARGEPSASSRISHPSFLRRWGSAVMGTLIVLCGIAAAVLTVVARRSGDWELVRVGAVASLLIVVLLVVFVVPPLLRSARAEAAQLDLPIQITTGGAIFISIFVVVALAAWNTGNNLLFLVFSVLFSTLFVAWTAARVSLRELAVSARFPDHIFAGEAAPVLVTVHNTKRVLPSFSIVVEARSRADEAATVRRGLARFRRERFERRVLAYFMYVPHGARVEQRVEQAFERRGHVLVTGFEISTRFPFGFFRVRRRLRARDVELVIYPKPGPVSDELHLLPIDAGRMPGARRGAGHDLHSLRDYQPQDDMRHIDWKATARLGQLVVREFTEEEERRVHIVFDTQLKAGEPGAGPRFERGVSIAASLISHFTDEHTELCLTLGEEQGRYGVGREHLYRCLRRLALVQPATKFDDTPRRVEFWQRIAPPPSATSDGYVILITAAAPGTIPANVWRKSHVIYL